MIAWVGPVVFLAFAAFELALYVAALPSARRAIRRRQIERLPLVFDGMEPPVTVVTTSANPATITALLELDYPELEVLAVIEDEPSAELRAAFALEPFPEAVRVRVPAADVRSVHASHVHPKLRVVSTAPGTPAQTRNTALNVARFPIVCFVPVGVWGAPRALRETVRPLLEDASIETVLAIVRDPSPHVLARAEAAREAVRRIGRAALGLRVTTDESVVALRKETAVAGTDTRGHVAVVGEPVWTRTGDDPAAAAADHSGPEHATHNRPAGDHHTTGRSLTARFAAALELGAYVTGALSGWAGLSAALIAGIGMNIGCAVAAIAIERIAYGGGRGSAAPAAQFGYRQWQLLNRALGRI